MKQYTLDEQLGFTKEAFLRNLSKLRKAICANVVLKIEEPFINEERKIDKGDVLVEEGTCQNERRNGSKYCQACSDKHNK